MLGDRFIIPHNVPIRRWHSCSNGKLYHHNWRHRGFKLANHGPHRPDFFGHDAHNDEREHTHEIHYRGHGTHVDHDLVGDRLDDSRSVIGYLPQLCRLERDGRVHHAVPAKRAYIGILDEKSSSATWTGFNLGTVADTIQSVDLSSLAATASASDVANAVLSQVRSVMANAGISVTASGAVLTFTQKVGGSVTHASSFTSSGVGTSSITVAIVQQGSNSVVTSIVSGDTITVPFATFSRNQDPNDGWTAIPFPAPITGLSTGTTYAIILQANFGTFQVAFSLASDYTGGKEITWFTGADPATWAQTASDLDLQITLTGDPRTLVSVHSVVSYARAGNALLPWQHVDSGTSTLNAQTSGSQHYIVVTFGINIPFENRMNLPVSIHCQYTFTSFVVRFVYSKWDTAPVSTQQDVTSVQVHQAGTLGARIGDDVNAQRWLLCPQWLR